jgi:hypothetical protein
MTFCHFGIYNFYLISNAKTLQGYFKKKRATILNGINQINNLNGSTDKILSISLTLTLSVTLGHTDTHIQT